MGGAHVPILVIKSRAGCARNHDHTHGRATTTDAPASRYELAGESAPGR
jgi:hypothetical protein